MLIILATWEAEIGRITVCGQGQKVHKTPSHVVAIVLSPALWESTHRRITVQAGLGLKWDPSSEITNTKKIGGVSQVRARLPSKPWAQTLVLPKKEKTELGVGRNEQHLEVNPCHRTVVTCLGHTCFVAHNYTCLHKVICVSQTGANKNLASHSSGGQKSKIKV
jgi:hypothetical protein